MKANEGTIVLESDWNQDVSFFNESAKIKIIKSPPPLSSLSSAALCYCLKLQYNGITNKSVEFKQKHNEEQQFSKLIYFSLFFFTWNDQRLSMNHVYFHVLDKTTAAIRKFVFWCKS